MVKVFAWPPVGVVARYWTPELPTGRSRSLMTGAEYVSAAQRRRLTAGFTVHGRRHYGSGYMEALWRLMDGGVHLVRLTSCKIPWGKTVPDELRGGQPFDWEIPPEPFEWITPPTEFTWLSGTQLEATLTTSGGLPAIEVGGLPPNAIIALPGEFVELFYGDDGETHMIAAEARSNGAGVAIIRLVTAPSGPGLVRIGASETGVFRLQSQWPRAMRRAGNTDEYSLDFREVFEDETDGFVEVNRWS